MPGDRDRVRVETGHKRVRAYLGGELVADTVRPLLVWEGPRYPAYYLPRADVRATLTPSGRVDRTSGRGEARYSTVSAGGREAVDAAREHPESPVAALRDHVRLEWGAMDAWFEEDTEVFVHPRDPYTRVDVLPSSRTVRIEVDGEVLAESSHPTVLFETGLPPRWYLPQVDVRMDRLVPTERVTGCPYKGFARYWSVDGSGHRHDDLAWSYPTPLPEAIGIAGMVCFYDERVDVTVDGVRRERPRTHFA